MMSDVSSLANPGGSVRHVLEAVLTNHAMRATPLGAYTGSFSNGKKVVYGKTLLGPKKIGDPRSLEVTGAMAEFTDSGRVVPGLGFTLTTAPLQDAVWVANNTMFDALVCARACAFIMFTRGAVLTLLGDIVDDNFDTALSRDATEQLTSVVYCLLVDGSATVTPELLGIVRSSKAYELLRHFLTVPDYEMFNGAPDALKERLAARQHGVWTNEFCGVPDALRLVATDSVNLLSADDYLAARQWVVDYTESIKTKEPIPCSP